VVGYCIAMQLTIGNAKKNSQINLMVPTILLKFFQKFGTIVAIIVSFCTVYKCQATAASLQVFPQNAESQYESRKSLPHNDLGRRYTKGEPARPQKGGIAVFSDTTGVVK
jgi:hypothetical protein